MKTLLLMRHAKSSWKDTELADHERPLNKRGKKDAPFMGEILKEKELLPQKILASTALRVRETVEGLVQGSDYTGEIEYSDALYLAEADVYRAAIQALPDTLERVLLIGHNPGMESLLQLLCGRIESLPTSSVAYISLPVQSWSEMADGVDGELIEMLLPRELHEAFKAKDKKEEKKEKKEEKKVSKKDSKKKKK